jgi:hypothetical protein
MFSKLMIAAATTALVALPSAAEARHHHGDRHYRNYSYNYPVRSYAYRN